MNEYTDEFDSESFINRCLKEMELNAVVGRKAKEIMKMLEEDDVVQELSNYKFRGQTRLI